MKVLRSGLLFFLLLAACDPVPVQYPPGSASYPSSYPTASGPSTPAASPPQAPPPPSQASAPQRGNYVWERMMDGVSMGGSIAGPYGAAAGLVLGAFYGLATADSHYEQINAQIQSEQAKDKELEAQIEREIERQRELEAQLGNATDPSAAKKREEIQLARGAIQEAKIEAKSDSKKEQINPLAAIGRKEIAPLPSGSPFKNVEVRDINGDGVADLWIYYNPLKPGEIIRQEEAANGDGKVNSWSYFNEGMLVRREVDTKGNGRPEIVYYYENDKLIREERDEYGDGRASFRAIFQNGRLARAEKDLDRDGRMDLWIYYDTSKETEVVLKEERDLNGDGGVDLWSYYEAGRLVRRDVSSAGLEIFSKQEEIPSLRLETPIISRPGS